GNVVRAGNDIYVSAAGNSPAGAVYRYDYSSGRRVDDITPSNGDTSMGYSLAPYQRGAETALIIGTQNESSPGAVYIYDATSGAIALRIPSPASTTDGFGSDVAQRGPDLVVGATDVNANPHGGAWIYPGGRCGDGVIDLGEECDDGNTADGDCCSSRCRIDTGSCSDGNVCNGTETCQGGTCRAG